MDFNQSLELNQKALEERFPNLARERKLFLNNHFIKSIEPNTFEKLNHLRELRLDTNQIGTIEPGTFDQLVNLERLDLDSNEIAKILPGTFDKLTRLEGLWLNNNKLVTFEPKIFDKLTNLRGLWLNRNQITTIVPDLFKCLKKVVVIQLEGNPLPPGTVSYYDGDSFVLNKPVLFNSDWDRFNHQFQLLSKPAFDVGLSDDSDEINDFENQNYKKLRDIGHGAFGVVYKVLEKKTGEIKAIKRTDEVSGRVEITSYKTLSHENIIRYFDSFEEEIDYKMYIFIVVEYCENGDLSRQIRIAQKSLQKMIPDEAILSWMTQAANGLRYLHSSKIVHRDIKPANLLLAANGKWLKICDLGLTKSLEDSVVRTLVGAPAYMSPELYFNSVVYPYKIDVWSLGCVIYELVRLEIAFKTHPRERLHWNFPAGDLRSFKEIVAKALEHDASNRADSEELYQELSALKIGEK